MDGQTIAEPLRAVVIAGALGAVLGLERERAGKPAGLRTHILVGVASALFVLLGMEAVEDFQDRAGGAVRTDPIRVIQAIVVGISFLGAGTILRDPEQGHVEGLTTAASILVTAAVGIAVATEKVLLAVAVTALVALTVTVLAWLESKLGDHSAHPENRRASGRTRDPLPRPPRPPAIDPATPDTDDARGSHCSSAGRP